MKYSLLCAFLWSTTGILVKSINHMPISLILFNRFIIALFFVLTLFLFTKKTYKNILNKNIGLKISLSLTMVFYYFCATYSFLYISVALATLLMSLSPCIAILYKFIKQEKIYKNEIIGFVFSFLGVLLYIIPSLKLDTKNLMFFLFGCLLAFISSVFKAINSIIIWKFKEDIQTSDLNVINIMTFMIASFFSFIIFFNSNLEPNYSYNNILILIVLGIFATALPSILNNIASRKTPPVVNTVIGMMTPLMAGVLAFLVLGEKLTLWSCMSLLISISGVLIIVLKRQ